MPAPVLTWRGSVDGAGFQNSGSLADPAVHGVRCAISGADVAGMHRIEGADVGGNGLWWTANAGLSKPDHNNTQSIHFSRSVSGVVFAMTGRGNGDILRSTDLGKTWAIAGGVNVSGNGSTAGTGAYRNTGRMFADSGTYVWACGYTGASTPAGASVVRSTDSGATFAAWGLTGREFRSIVVDPQDPTILYGAQEAGTSPGLVKLSNCKAAAGTAPTVTQLTGAGAAQGATLTSLRDVQAVVEGTKTWVYFISHVGTVSRVWKFNATDGTSLTDITGTLSTASLWTTIDAYRNTAGTATVVWLGCWEPRKTGSTAEAVVVSRDSGTTWVTNVTWAGTSYNLPTGLPWWRTAVAGQKSWAVNGGTFDANVIRTEPGNRGTVYVFGRAGVWRTVDDGATWQPLMEDLLVSMSHGTVPNDSNPGQVANLNVDWGCLLTNNKWLDVTSQQNVGDNAFGGCFNARGLIVGFGSRSDVTPATNGSIWSTTSAASGDAATWDNQNWASAFPGVAAANIPRCLGVVDGLAANGDRIIIAVAQGQKTGTTETNAGGIYRKVIPAGGLPGAGTWAEVGGTTAFAGWGVNNTLEAHLYWPAGTPYIYAYDRQTGLWRSSNYGAAGSWERISTQTTTTTYAGFIAGAGSTVWLATSTQLLRFTGAHTAPAPITPTVLTLPAALTRPGPIAWDAFRGGLAIAQRVGTTPVGLWWADDADTAAAPAWTEVGDERYKSAALYTQGMAVASDGTYYVDGWGNASIVGEEVVVTPPPTGFSINETWESSAAGSTPTSPPSAFNTTGKARITALNPWEGTQQCEFWPTLQTGYIETPPFAATSLEVDVILDLQNLPSANTRFISPRLGTANQGGVTITTTGAVQLQDVNLVRDSAAPVLVAGTRYRIAAKWDVASASCQLRIWSGTDLTVATPTYDSGAKTYAGGLTGGNFDALRIGAPAPVTWLARVDAILAKTDGTWPARATTGGAVTATDVGYIPIGIAGTGPAPVAKPRRLVSGLMARRIDQINATNVPLLQAGAGGGAALNAYWYHPDPALTASKSLQLVPGQLNEAGVLSLIADMNTCLGYGLPIFLRIQGGYYSPPHARAAGGGPAGGGGMTYYSNDGSVASGAPAPSDPSFRMLPLPMPLVWTPGFGQTFDEFLQMFAGEERIMAHASPPCGVSVSGPMMQFAEPFTRKFINAENRAAATGAGWTDALDTAAFYRSFRLQGQLFNPRSVASHLAMGVKETIDAAGLQVISEPSAITMLDDFVAILGGFGVSESNNATFPVVANPNIENEMIALRARTTPPPVGMHEQTRTLGDLEAAWDAQAVGSKQTTPYAVADAYVTRGAHAIEMPGGWENASVTPTGTTRWAAFTAVQAADINNRALAKVTGLDQFHV